MHGERARAQATYCIITGVQGGGFLKLMTGWIPDGLKRFFFFFFSRFSHYKEHGRVWFCGWSGVISRKVVFSASQRGDDSGIAFRFLHSCLRERTSTEVHGGQQVHSRVQMVHLHTGFLWI